MFPFSFPSERYKSQKHKLEGDVLVVDFDIDEYTLDGSKEFTNGKFLSIQFSHLMYRFRFKEVEFTQLILGLVDDTLVVNVNSNYLVEASFDTYDKVYHGGSLNIGSSVNKIFLGLKLPDKVDGDLNLSFAIPEYGIKLPDFVGGDVELNSSKLPPDMKLPDIIGGNLNLYDASISPGLKLPSSVAGEIDLRNAIIPPDIMGKFNEKFGEKLRVNPK